MLKTSPEVELMETLNEWCYWAALAADAQNFSGSWINGNGRGSFGMHPNSLLKTSPEVELMETGSYQDYGTLLFSKLLRKLN